MFKTPPKYKQIIDSLKKNFSGFLAHLENWFEQFQSLARLKGQTLSAEGRDKSRRLKKRFVQDADQLQKSMSEIIEKANRSFRTFPILLKVNLILISIVIVVVTLLSTLVMNFGEQMLRTRLDEFCTVIIKTLAKPIGGPLLEGDKASITETVLRLERMEITGLEAIVVYNREGGIYTHSTLQTESDSTITPEKLAYVVSVTKLQMEESEAFYEYYYPVFITDDFKVGTVEIKFSKKVVLEPIARTSQFIVLVAIIIVLLSIVGIYFLSQKMVIQIHQLSEGAKQVARGNLDVEIPVKSKDELGRLCQEFNFMIIGLREKLQMQKFVSKATVKMIQEHGNGSELPRKSDKRFISVLFSDVRKFSQIAENYSPEDVVEWINIYLDLQARIIEQNHGIVDKFVGDQVMGVFEGQNNEIHALISAVGMQKAIRELNRRRVREGKVILEVGIGLNNGVAVLGNIGSQDRMDYTVVGSIVNLGNHICNKALPNQIIATENFIEKINGRHKITQLEPILIKGRSAPIPIFEIDYK